MVSALKLGENPVIFQRTTGINYTTFQVILMKLAGAVAAFKAAHPLSKRGRKTGHDLSQDLLLTLLYMRQYPTFLSLGQAFSMSESYAYKRYCYVRQLLPQLLPMPALDSRPANKVAVDVSEQPIERPVKGQKQYYSGKKKGIR